MKKTNKKYIAIMSFLSVMLLSSSYHQNDGHEFPILSKPPFGGNLNYPNYGFSNTESSKIDRVVSIYINPSVQTWNLYAGNLGNEAEHMQIIATEMYYILSSYSFLDVDGNFEKKGMSLVKSVEDSNSKHRDIHIALHSNAGGGNGSEIYTKNNYEFAKTVYNDFMKEIPFYSRGVKDGNHLYEVKNINATNVALIEFLFHDNLKEATYIVNNHYHIAYSLSMALINYILITY